MAPIYSLQFIPCWGAIWAITTAVLLASRWHFFIRKTSEQLNSSLANFQHLGQHPISKSCRTLKVDSPHLPFPMLSYWLPSHQHLVPLLVSDHMLILSDGSRSSSWASHFSLSSTGWWDGLQSSSLPSDWPLQLLIHFSVWIIGRLPVSFFYN